MKIPTSRPCFLSLLRRFAVLILALSFAATGGTAADRVWSGGGADDNWSTPANWVGGVAPAPNDFLYFGGTTRLSANNDFPAGTVFKSITFLNSAGSFSLSGNPIVLTNGNNGGGGTVNGGSITNASTSAQTIGLPVTISAGQHYIATLTGAGALNFAAAITRQPGATVAFSRLGGSINVNGTGLALNNGIIGGWATFGGVKAASTSMGRGLP